MLDCPRRVGRSGCCHSGSTVVRQKTRAVGPNFDLTAKMQMTHFERDVVQMRFGHRAALSRQIVSAQGGRAGRNGKEPHKDKKDCCQVAYDVARGICASLMPSC